jgi:tetratricopeptide (TPR) repeat protein
MKIKLKPSLFHLWRALISAGLLLLAVRQNAPATANPNDTAWSLLIGNKPMEARELFLKNTASKDKIVAGEAYRGLSDAARFLGDDFEEAAARFKSCRADNQAALFAAGLLTSYSFGRSAEGYKIKEGYDLLRELSKKPSIFCGQYNDLLAERYANDGNLGDALRIISNMSTVRSWMFIGPFDNISNSGYNTTFPPETEVDFSRSYPGKDGNDTKWSTLDNRAPSAWIFTEHHTSSRNAVFYFYCTVSSKTAQEACLAFGASGSFKIFLNGECVCADSVFRNTGADVFMQHVALRAGNNSLLVKLCHEWGASLSDETKLSNFLLRFLDSTYAPCKNISYSLVPVHPEKGKAVRCFYAPSPLVDTIVGVLSGRLSKNDNDMDAAVLLMKAYNGLEKTDDGQILARRYLKKYPASSLWHQLYAESLLRSKKYTEGETELKTAFKLCPQNHMAWVNELHSVTQRSDPLKVLDFIAGSPEPVKSSLAALIAKINAYIGLENKAEALKNIGDLEKKYSLEETACAVLAGVFIEQGDAKKAENLIREFLSHKHTDSGMYKARASIALKQGDLGKATDVIFEGLKYNPDNAASYYTLSSLNYSGKKYAQAREYIEKCLALVPADADALNLKGNILISLGDTKQAKQTFTDAIRFTSDDFNAWENLRTLENKPSLESLAPLPSLDSLIRATRAWEFRSHENGAILSWIDDVFYYPSHCSRERTFFVVALATQKAIDTWKEYSIDYNGHFQVLHISRALSCRSDGSQVQADVMKNKVVFKSLQPGDCIVLEWSLKNYFMGDMATNVYGTQEFELSYPAFDTRLRLITPALDTVPYRVYGDSIQATTSRRDDYRVAQFRYPAHKNILDETFTATDWPAKKRVNYSTFSSWSEIVKWYDGLTRHKQDNTLELKALADSLTAGPTATATMTALQKISRVHEYITGSIRYSYVPFRQSGWIPQDAHDVLATKIGDCKDMASLGKSLLDIAGIPSCLVLVNTGVRHYTDHTYIGPDFNHCILCYTIDGTDRYLDLTASEYAMTSLPKEDQGALALLVRPGSDHVITLPFDKPASDLKRRTAVSMINDKGTLNESMATVRTGRFAGEFRERFRFLSVEKRNADMHQALAQAYPDITLDTFTITGLNTVGDTVSSVVVSTARNTVTFSGTTAIFPLHITDNVESNDYPVEEKRAFPIDMSRAWYDISTADLSGKITFPPAWRPISLPENVTIDSPYGSYRMQFKRNGNVILYHRTAVFTLDRQLPASEHPRLKAFLNTVSKSDVVQLLFFTK